MLTFTAPARRAHRVMNAIRAHAEGLVAEGYEFDLDVEFVGVERGSLGRISYTYSIDWTGRPAMERLLAIDLGRIVAKA